MGVVLLLGDDKSDELYRELFTLLSKVVSNTFNVLDASYDKVAGLALYRTASLLNHSCQPNCVSLFDGTRLSIRSIEKISQGEQVREGEGRH